MPGRIRGVVATAVGLTALTMWSAANAETESERNACFGDAFRVCWSAIPSRNEVFTCLMKNRNLLSEPCRVVMDQYRHPHRHRRPTRYSRVND
jgi:hypothetical protein